AEKFSTIDCLLKKSFTGYPETRLTKAWENKIFPDHGWGGKHGDITDALFEAKYTSALSEAKQLTETALKSIASTIQTNNKKGIPVIVFNSLSWERTDPVSITVNFDPSKAASLKLYNGEGKEIAVQMSKADYYTDGSLKSATVCFIAEEIPSLGYKTFYLKPSLNKIPEEAADNNSVIENAFYQIELTNGGIKQIRDKKLNVDLLKTDRYLGAEVFTMRSIGNGAGEFSDIQKPDAEGFDKLSNHTSKWVMTDNGPVYKAWKLRCPIRNAIVEQKIIVYTLLPKIDFEVSLLNWEGILYREFRFALPLNTDNGKVAYEVPFGVVEVGKDEIHGSAGERYTTPCKDVHPRGIENWMSVSGNGFGVTLSSSVAVCDYLDPLNDNNKQSILQPILIASRKSCHSEGNEYLQTGDHSFNFSLTSHAEGWKNGFRFGREANEKLIAMIAPTPFKNAFLPETLSFFSVSNPNIMVSTIKKSEDDNDVVIRLFETEGADCNLSLSSFFKFNKAQRTNLIEENGLSLPMTGKSLTVPVGHNSIETFKLEQ
ncbi:MAG: glycoside hydrolase family 38 C-terminal domain-containing protein, partial [Bacteroidota bacterium]|nr:glycoside hydrolase family 38 C-terminal domain-containing protein [Bacteroidota bacterium]